jgi:hypothetical protein
MRMPSAIPRMMTRMRGRRRSRAGVNLNGQFSRVKSFRLKRRDSDHVFIRWRHYSWGMLFLSAFARLIPREPEANDLLAESHAALGHLGLTIIALVFVLVTFWKS